MMKPWILALASACVCAGCTTLSLERHSLAQSASSIDLRYYEVLDNLAMIADNPAALPAYSSALAGTAEITDLAELGSTTEWQHVISKAAQNGFASQELSPHFSRNIRENWAIDPVVGPEKLEAIRAACRWVIYGQEQACYDCPGLLDSPEQAPYPGRHFGVADRLARLPTWWLHTGHLKDVPLGARYKAHSGRTWIWVMPDGIQGLADFTLILENIARVNINSPTECRLPPQGPSLQHFASI